MIGEDPAKRPVQPGEALPRGQVDWAARIPYAERTRTAATFDGLVLGPDDHLVLRPRIRLSPEDLAVAGAQVPEALVGRVLVVSADWDVFVVKKEEPDGVR